MTQVNNALQKELARGFNLDPPVSDRVEMLVALWSEARHGRVVLLGQLDVLPLSYVQRREERLVALDRYGWVNLGPVQSPIDPVTLTAEGIAVGEDIDKRRVDHRGRRRAARDAMLYWLDEPENASVREVAVEAMGQFGSFLGTSFTAEEIEAAATWLHDEGYIKGIGAWGAGIIRPQLTSKGSRIVESDGSTSPVAGNNLPAGGGGLQIGSQHNYFGAHGTVNNAARDVHSSGPVTLTKVQRNSLRDIIDLLATAQPRVASESADDAVIIEQAHDDLAAQADADEPDPGILRHALSRVADVATRVGATVGTLTYAAHQATDLMAALPS